jgi:hypothetical protein
MAPSTVRSASRFWGSVLLSLIGARSEATGEIF